MTETADETTEDENSTTAQTQPEKESKERLEEFSSAVERLQEESESDSGCGC